MTAGAAYAEYAEHTEHAEHAEYREHLWASGHRTGRMPGRGKRRAWSCVGRDRIPVREPVAPSGLRTRPVAVLSARAVIGFVC
ncbi:hypothetical protein ABIA38_001351 [Embleya sp. AB8]